MAERAPTIPVFFDPTGRRQRLFRAFGRILAVAASAYLVLAMAGLMGATWVPSLRLPGLGAVIPRESVHAPPALGSRAMPIVAAANSPSGAQIVTSNGASRVTGSSLPAGHRSATGAAHSGSSRVTASAHRNGSGHGPGTPGSATKGSGKSTTAPGLGTGTTTSHGVKDHGASATGHSKTTASLAHPVPSPHGKAYGKK